MNTDLPPALPTIPEDQATGEIAALYADMRAVLRIPVVNLIWRHVAALPGALAWGWGTLRPLYASGAVDAAAERVVAGLALPDLPRLSPAALAAVGVTRDDAVTVSRVLDTYHRANPLNLVALAALLARLEGRAPAGTASGRAAPTPPSDPPAPLPPMLEVKAMPEVTAALAWELAALGVDGAPGEMPSVWRNLAHWPGYLAVALTQLRPLEASGWLGGAMNGLRTARDAEAAALLAAGMGTPDAPLPAPEARAAMEAALRRFTDGLIVRMVPLLAVLRSTLPPVGGS